MQNSLAEAALTGAIGMGLRESEKQTMEGIGWHRLFAPVLRVGISCLVAWQ